MVCAAARLRNVVFSLLLSLMPVRRGRCISRFAPANRSWRRNGACLSVGDSCILNGMPGTTPFPLTQPQRRQLRHLRQSHSRESRVGLRARIALLAGDGMSNRRIAEQLDTDVHTVARWRRRFERDGVAGLLRELPRSGRPRQIDPRCEGEVVEAFCSAPANAVSTRSLAAQLGISHSSVARIWKRVVAERRRPAE